MAAIFGSKSQPNGKMTHVRKGAPIFSGRKLTGVPDSKNSFNCEKMCFFKQVNGLGITFFERMSDSKKLPYCVREKNFHI